MSVDDRKRLTSEEAYELVNKYVRYFWARYSEGLRNKDREDVISDIYLKLAEPHENAAYDPEWKPGQPIKMAAWVKDDEGARTKGYKDIDTEYMLEVGYNPEDPYDPNYFLPRIKEFNYLDKYDGSKTSKKIYVMRIVDNNMQIMSKKKEIDRYAKSFDEPLGDDDDSGDFGSTIAGDDNVTDSYERKELHDIIADVIDTLSNGVTGHEGAGAIGWSPLTGRVGPNGEHIESAFTERDAALHLLCGYDPETVATYYRRTDTGKPISKATVSAKYARVKDKIKQRILALPDGKKQVLRNFGFRIE